MKPSAWMLAPALVLLAAPEAIAQGKPKTSDQIRQECHAEYPSGSGYRDRSDLINKCIQRKKAEAGGKH